MADDPRRGALAQWRTTHVADGSGQRAAASVAEQRERQRDMQAQLARRLHHHGPAYVELVSPARPEQASHAGYAGYAGYGGRQTHARRPDALDGASRSARRTSPAEALNEIDQELRQSFGGHQRPSVSMSRDAADHVYSGGYADGAFANDRPPPVMAVRVQHPRQPFREEISSDLSDHPGRSPVSSAEPGYRMSHEPISDDLGLHLPLTKDFETIPSISLTPPASPAHRSHHAPSASTGHYPPTQSKPHVGQGREDSPEALGKGRPVFSTWSLGFLAGCVVVGLSGMFVDELLQFASMFFKTSPLMLSRIEQREMDRRLDILQQELLSFRVAANDIEFQSERMVQEVRSHLEKMKFERERHQQMISKEMDTLREYVQGVTNELVEDEKKEIRKRLMETIEEAVVEESRNHQEQSVPSGTENTKKGEDQVIDDVVEEKLSSQPVEYVEVEISAAQGNAAGLFEEVDEDAIMQQIQQAVAEPDLIPPSIQPAHEQVESIDQEKHEEPSMSIISVEWMLLLIAVTMLAGVAGIRVRNAARRKSMARRSWRFPARTKVLDHSESLGTEDSEVETVAFFRSDNEASESEGRYADPSDDDGFSTYSEEQKDGEDGDSNRDDDEENVSASSADDYDFHAAELSAEPSDVEAIDETPTKPSTPYPSMQARLDARLTDDSPSVRRSNRIQRLSQMR